MQEEIDARPLAEANDDARPDLALVEVGADDGPPPESGGGVGEPVLKTPAAWASALGHTDPAIKVDPEFGPVLPKGADRRKLRGWIFKAAAAHAGWGTKVAEDVLLTRAEYEAAVNAALALPVGEAKTEARLRAIEAARDAAKEATR